MDDDYAVISLRPTNFGTIVRGLYFCSPPLRVVTSILGAKIPAAFAAKRLLEHP